MAIQKLVGALLVAAVAGQAAADVIQMGDVIQVSNRSGTVFTPTPVPSDGSGLQSTVSYRLNGTAHSAYAGLYVMDYSHDLSAGSTSWTEFLSFCLEPDVALTSFSNPYTVMSLGSAGYNADAVAELWGRYRSNVVDDLSAAAFQVALWELGYDSGTTHSFSTGLFRSNGAITGAFAQANSWLASLNGTGPKARNLAVLVDNPNDSNDRQDLLIELPVDPDVHLVPEPATALLMGVGLLGFGLRRRKD